MECEEPVDEEADCEEVVRGEEIEVDYSHADIGVHVFVEFKLLKLLFPSSLSLPSTIRILATHAVGGPAQCCTARQICSLATSPQDANPDDRWRRSGGIFIADSTFAEFTRINTYYNCTEYEERSSQNR